MQLQELLQAAFGKGLDRGNCFFNWYAKDLKTFSDDELRLLNRTCIYFRPEDKALASKLQNRIGTEWYRRDKEKRIPTIKIKRNRGKKK